MTITKDNLGSKFKLFKIENLLIGISLAYIALIIFLPAVNVFTEAFKNGIVPFFSNFSNQEFLSAIRLTLIIAFVCVPVNTVFGLCAAWAIARHKFPGRAFIISVLDLPFSISPVVAGLMIMLLYGRQGWLGGFLEKINLKIVFATPGIILATAFITLPFVAREVIPVLEEMGREQEEAARTLGAQDWQIFWRVTLPNIRWGLLYGVILTNARAMGEFGAVSVVSGNIAGETQSLPLFVEQAYKQYQTQEAFSASVLLALLALVTLVAKTIVEQKTQIKEVE
jgi:sulfate transport system permease protein